MSTMGKRNKAGFLENATEVLLSLLIIFIVGFGIFQYADLSKNNRNQWALKVTASAEGNANLNSYLETKVSECANALEIPDSIKSELKERQVTYADLLMLLDRDFESNQEEFLPVWSACTEKALPGKAMIVSLQGERTKIETKQISQAGQDRVQIGKAKLPGSNGAISISLYTLK